MKRAQEQLLALLRLAIHPEDEIPEVLLESAIDWEVILDEAKKQSVIGIAYAGVKIWKCSDIVKEKGASIDNILLTKWHALSERIKQDNLNVNKRTSQVCYNFAKDGFRTSVMKGQGNALLYGENLSLLRSSGDIDVWVEGGFQKVYDYVMKVAPTNVINEKEIDFKVFSDVVVEVHYLPFIIRHPFRNKRLQQFFESQAEACYHNHVQLQTVDKNGEEQWADAIVTTVPFNLVHQLAHIKLHLFNGGIGLRHIIDYYFQLVHAEKSLNQEEKDYIVKVITSLGLEKLAQAITWVLDYYFGIPKACHLWKSYKEDGEFLVEEIFKTGNFGRGKKKRNKKIKRGTLQSFFNIQKHNLRLFRFDTTDWFWGSLWRIYYFAWRSFHGFTH